MVNPKVDEQSMMTYLSQFPNARLNPEAPIRPRTNAARVRAYGPGRFTSPITSQIMSNRIDTWLFLYYWIHWTLGVRYTMSPQSGSFLILPHNIYHVNFSCSKSIRILIRPTQLHTKYRYFWILVYVVRLLLSQGEYSVVQIVAVLGKYSIIYLYLTRSGTAW